jgi:hypothetical protein
MKKKNIIGYPIDSISCDKVRHISIIMALFIIILMVVLVHVEHDKRDQQSYYEFWTKSSYWIMKILCLIQLLTTGLYFWMWLILKAPLAYRK